jgi:hypothetical protein
MINNRPIKKYISILLFLLIVNSVFSQKDSDIQNQFLVNALWPGVSYELGVAKSSSLKLDAAVSLGVLSFDDSGFDVFPRLDAQFRHYYNFDRRRSKDKSTAGNSGNFFGLHGYYTSDISLLGSDYDPELLNIILFGPAAFETFYIGATYGLQRTYASGFNWGWQFGLGIISVDYTETGSNVTVTDQFSVYPNFRVTVGWVLSKNKMK